MDNTTPFPIYPALAGKRTLLTGASRGLGRLLTRALAANGVELLLAARNGQQLQQLQDELLQQGLARPGQITLHPCDLAQPVEVLQLAQQAQALYGSPDFLLNNAALMLTQHSSAALCQTLAVNLQAPMLLCQSLLPAMQHRGSGHILNLASVAAFLPVAHGELYAAGKHGLLGYTRSLRTTLSRQHCALAVSMICPGLISGAGLYAD